MNKRQANRFQKGSGVYKCGGCGKLTRSTGRGDNEHVQLCVDCFERAGDYNSVMDGHMSVEDFNKRWPNKPYGSSGD